MVIQEATVVPIQVQSLREAVTATLPLPPAAAKPALLAANRKLQD